MAQEGDVKLFQTLDDGNISVVNGVTEMTPGLEVAAYTALFGGNVDDDGRDKNPNNWWGNLSEVDLTKQYRSETQFLLESIPATSGNLQKMQEAAKRDLQFFKDIKAANTVDVFATIPGLNKLNLRIVIEANGIETEFNFTENWKAST